MLQKTLHFTVLAFSLIGLPGMASVTPPVGETFQAAATSRLLTLALRDGEMVIEEDGTEKWSRPTGSVSALTIRGNDLDNTLVVDFSEGNPVSAGSLTFDGVNRGTDFDTLSITGGRIVALVSDAENSHDGDLRLSLEDGSVAVIHYRNIEPVDMTGSTATDFLFNLPSGVDNSELSDIGAGNLRLESNPTTFETTDFAVPTGSVSINGGAGDILTITNALSFTASLTASVPTIDLGGDVNTGSLTLNGDTTLSAAVDFGIGGTTPGSGASQHEQFEVNGSLTIAGASLSLSQRGGFTPGPGDTFVILDNDAADPVSGTFAGLPEGAPVPGGIGGVSVSISYMGGDGNDVVLSTSADLVLAISDSPDPAIAGDAITYTITSTNNGPDDAGDLAIVGDTPPGTVFASASPSAGASCTTPAVGSAGTVTCAWSGGTALGEVRTLTMAVRLCSGQACLTNVVEDSVSTSSSTSDPDLTNNSQTGVGGTVPAVTTAVESQSSFTFTQSDSPDPVDSGSQITYTLDVSNQGPSDAADVILTDTLPGGLVFVSASSANLGSGVCGEAAGVVTCNLGTLGAPGQCGALPTADTVTIVVDVPVSATPGPYVNSAGIASNNCLADLGTTVADQTTTVDVLAILLEKSGALDTGPDGLANPNDPIDYTFAVTNTGSVTVSSISVTDPLVTSITCPSGNPIPSLAPGATETCTGSYAITLGDVDAGQRVNTATAAGEDSSAVPVSDTDTQTEPIPQAADLVLAKTADPLFVERGETAVFRLEVVNQGPATATSVEVVDDLPIGLSWVSDTCGAGPPVGQVWSWVVGDLAPSTSAVCEMTVSVDPDAEDGEVLNVADASSSIGDPDPASAQAGAPLGIQVAAIEIPTLGGIGFAWMSMLLALLAVGRLVRRNR